MLKPFSLNRINRSTYNQLAVDGEINADALYSVVEENGSSSLYWGTKPAVQGTGQLKPVFGIVRPLYDDYTQDDFWTNLADETVPVGFRILVSGPFNVDARNYSGTNTGIEFFSEMVEMDPVENQTSLYFPLKSDEKVYVVEKGPDGNPIVEIVNEGCSVRFLTFGYRNWLITYLMQLIVTWDMPLTTIDCEYYTEGPLLEPGGPV